MANEKRRKELFLHIIETARVKGIRLLQIGGMSDHVHCLLDLSTESRLSDVVRLIKAEARFWYNNRPMARPLEWQDGYFAVSVSPKDEEGVKQYIKNQEKHHSTRSYEDEFREFIRIANMEREE